MNRGIPATCGYCGRPISFLATWVCGRPYHNECTHGPDYAKNVYQMPALTEERIREIVRDEIRKGMK